MHLKKRKAFTMTELVFVIVVIGILAAVAVPKMAATRDDAVITKAIATVAAVRNAMATERQKRILRGRFTDITSLNSDGGNNIFSKFSDDGDGNTDDVLAYARNNCTGEGKSKGCWKMNGTDYQYVMPNGTTVDFTLVNAAGTFTNRFNCVDTAASNCKLLTQ